MRRIALPFLFLILFSAACPVRAGALGESQCQRLEQQRDRVHEQMRRPHKAARGNELRARLRELNAKIAHGCR